VAWPGRATVTLADAIVDYAFEDKVLFLRKVALAEKEEKAVTAFLKRKAWL
jgi:hypothetical protein